MNRPIVIVDPRSSGVELAPLFKARGISVIAVTLKPIGATKERKGFGTDVLHSDFEEIIPEQEGLLEILKSRNPFAIIPGADGGVELADFLSHKLTPEFSNDPKRSKHRFHKAYMQKALEEEGLSFIKTLNATSLPLEIGKKEVETWLQENDLLDSPLIIKPPISAGSDKVFHIPSKGNWKKPFERVVKEPSNITGKLNETVVVQEQIIGVEFAVGTVSLDGKHYLTHLIRYNKKSIGERKTVFDYVEFIEFNEREYGELFEYTKKCLDALGILWGAAHNEVMFTEKGPRLIESGNRMLGGPSVGFSRIATGSSQADKLVEAYVDGDIQSKEYKLHKTVVPVFLHSPVEGIISNTEALDQVSKLSTFADKFIWFENGSRVPMTVDYLSSIGIIALAGDRESILKDYQKIRVMESKLIIQ